jgi:hypothetical protein
MAVRTLSREPIIYFPSLRCVLRHWCDGGGGQFSSSRQAAVLNNYDHLKTVGWATWRENVHDAIEGSRALSGTELLVSVGHDPGDALLQEYVISHLRTLMERASEHLLLASTFYMVRANEFIWRFTELVMTAPNALSTLGSTTMHQALAIHSDTKTGGACRSCGERGVHTPGLQEDWRPNFGRISKDGNYAVA